MNWQNITQGFNRLIRLNSSELDQPKRLLVTMTQSGYAIGRDLLNGQIQLHAMSLVYTTLLSIVPLLALSVSVLKSFGVHNQLEPILQNFLEPMGPKGLELSGQIISFVENMNVAVLGSVGIGLLFYTAISLIQKVEGSFNYIWRVKHRRTLAQQVSHYLSVLMIGPVLLVSLVGVVASTMNTGLMKTLLSFDTLGFAAWFSTYILPTLIVTALITSVYMFVPNTKVRLPTAGVGAFFAAILWQAGGSVFSFFVVSSTNDADDLVVFELADPAGGYQSELLLAKSFVGIKAARSTRSGWIFTTAIRHENHGVNCPAVPPGQTRLHTGNLSRTTDNLRQRSDSVA